MLAEIDPDDRAARTHTPQREMQRQLAAGIARPRAPLAPVPVEPALCAAAPAADEGVDLPRYLAFKDLRVGRGPRCSQGAFGALAAATSAFAQNAVLR